MALRHEATDVMGLQLLQRRLFREAEQYIEVAAIAFTGQRGQAPLLREVSDIGGSHHPIVILHHALSYHLLLLSAEVAAFLHAALAGAPNLVFISQAGVNRRNAALTSSPSCPR